MTVSGAMLSFNSVNEEKALIWKKIAVFYALTMLFSGVFDAFVLYAGKLDSGNLIIFHNALSEFHKQSPDKPPQDPNEIERLYSSIAQDCYAFYSEVIARIQEGRVGKRSWKTMLKKRGRSSQKIRGER